MGGPGSRPRCTATGSRPWAAVKASASPGQRRATPAAGRAAAVGADRAATAPVTTSAQTGHGTVEAAGGRRRGASRTPGAARTGRRRRSPPPSRRVPARARRRARRRRRAGRCGALERHLVHAGKALVQRRRLELADRPHLRVGAITPSVLRASARSSSGVGRAPNSVDQARDEVDLRLGERRVEPHAADRQPVPGGRLDHVAARGAREVGVVQDDPSRAGAQPLLERLRDVAQRAAPLVAVEALIAAGHVVAGEARLAGARGCP